MAKENLKELTEKELQDKLKDYLEEMRNLRVQMVMGQVENRKRKWLVKKRISQIKTFLNQYKSGVRDQRKTEESK